MKITQNQKKLLESQPVAVATVNQDNTPNVIPIAFAKVVDDKIIITDNFMKQTVANLKNNPAVCLAVWSQDWEEGYKFIGQSSYHDSGRWLEFVKSMKENRGLPAKGAVVVQVERVIKLG